ncbi:UNKNOWN [Stylonychia lemnae]|uniref:Uncharacterized protein n=1 Tax=Stylonychia lemnae TaxID=5949 RepID=A0A078ASS2_STYLE|nr:UNKNOWN [Stylonychia lemnae]|eukprot:CDW85525.1 UNKNOWN [Stylonychia lemnae]
MTIGLYFGNRALRSYHPRMQLTNYSLLYLVSMYMAPIFAAWMHFPDRKGLVSGVILAGFGLGVFIYNIVSNKIANPQNLSPNAFLSSNSTICDCLICGEFQHCVGSFMLFKKASLQAKFGLGINISVVSLFIAYEFLFSLEIDLMMSSQQWLDLWEHQQIAHQDFLELGQQIIFHSKQFTVSY